jgi:Yip1 domain
MPVPATTNSADVFAILDARRGTSVADIKPKKQAVVPQVDSWTPSTWIAGLKRGKVWVSRMLHTLVLDRTAYQEVARDPYMTGPALLIGAIGLALSTLTITGNMSSVAIIGRIVGWPVTVLFLQLTARLLGGKASYTRTFRVTGFAYFAYWLVALSPLPVIGPFIRAIGFILEFLGVWLGVAQAHELRGWRTLLLPVMLIVVVAVVSIVMTVLLAGAAITVESLMVDFGL